MLEFRESKHKSKMDVLLEQITKMVREKRKKQNKQVEYFRKVMKLRIQAKRRIREAKERKLREEKKMLKNFSQPKKVSAAVFHSLIIIFNSS